MGWSLLLCPILCLLFLFILFPSYSSLNPLCNLDESSALLQFKNSFTLNNSIPKRCARWQSSYPKTASWKNGTDCCMWDRVTCDTLSGHVIGLDLSCSWLYGELHSNSTLFQLTYLQMLNLAFNFFNWSQISFKFGGLASLTHINLSYSAFNGEIPSEISCLSKLVSLDLSSNQVLFSTMHDDKCLTIEPSIWKSFIQNVTNLQYLILNRVDMSSIKPNSLGLLMNLSSSLVSLGLVHTGLQGTLPNNILHLPNLQHLFLALNPNLSIQLSKSNWSSPLKYLSLFEINLSKQSLDSIGHLKSLEFLDLGSCGIQETNQQFFQNLTQLTTLSLYRNNFTGKIPSSLSNHKHLIFLDLSDNNFNGQIPNFLSQPSRPENINGFSKLTSLKYLYLNNNQLTGHIGEFSSYSLSALDLSHNLFSSIESFSCWSIQVLDLSFNLLEGDLPIPWVGTEFFSVSNNKLTGHVSSMICNASSLNILNLSHNKLIGVIPQCLVTLPNLSVMDVQMNNLFGTIPGNISETNMFQTLKFNNNQLEGPLPQSLSHCKLLEVLDLGDNEIEDTFPNWLESLEELQVLVLQGNHFHGKIADLKSKHPFPQLRIFDVSNNHFSGPLPAIYIQQFKGMMDIDDSKIGLQYMKDDKYSSYYDSVLITMKGVPMELTRILLTFTTIDLSNNKFEGEILEAIGELNSLKGLNLSHNRITNTIPPSLGNLKSLEWLDLSSNNLTGEIPKALTNLNYLSTLNLSQNQLVGTIPQEKQFGTFSNDSYKGNPGLCGFPLSKGCDSGEGEQQPSSSMFHDDDEFGLSWKAVAVGYGCGFLFGVLMGYLVLSAGKPQWLVKVVEGRPKKMVRNKKSRASANRG